ncbi:MAG: hypothetical protein ACYDDO_00255 [Acidiferrobacterales bacterium]
MKKIVIGVILGALAAFPLGFNFGRGVPILTNPFARHSELSGQVKEKAAEVVKSTKEAIHNATAPTRREADKKLNR